MITNITIPLRAGAASFKRLLGANLPHPRVSLKDYDAHRHGRGIPVQHKSR